MPIVQLPNGDLRDEIRQPLFSSVSLAGSAIAADPAFSGNVQGNNANSLDQYKFFSFVSGAAQWQTNLRQPNLLETAVSYRVQGMALDADYVNETVDAQSPGLLPLIQNFGSIAVQIGEKQYWQGPLTYLLGRIVQNGSISTISAAGGLPVAPTSYGFMYQHAGQPAVQGVILSGRHVVDINPLQTFYALISMDAPVATNTSTSLAVAPGSGAINDYLNLTFSFKGLQRRPVQ